MYFPQQHFGDSTKTPEGARLPSTVGSERLSLPASMPAYAADYISDRAELHHSASGVAYYQAPSEHIVGAELRAWVEAFNQAERERLNAVEVASATSSFWVLGGAGMLVAAAIGYYVWKKNK